MDCMVRGVANSWTYMTEQLSLTHSLTHSLKGTQEGEDYL